MPPSAVTLTRTGLGALSRLNENQCRSTPGEHYGSQWFPERHAWSHKLQK